jgi:hypothetical protein
MMSAASGTEIKLLYNKYPQIIVEISACPDGNPLHQLYFLLLHVSIGRFVSFKL